MTDNEIIKALECCINGDSCEGCPLIGDEVCTDNLRKYPLDLINRQRVEIERLEKLKGFADLGKLYSEIKSEAIKEFAERLRDTSEDCTDRGKPYVLCEDIDNLVKEMVGENNG